MHPLFRLQQRREALLDALHQRVAHLAIGLEARLAVAFHRGGALRDAACSYRLYEKRNLQTQGAAAI